MTTAEGAAQTGSVAPRSILVGGIITTTPGAGTSGQQTAIALDTAGRIIISAGSLSLGTVSLGAGTAAIGTVALGSGTAGIGTVGLAAGTAAVGTIVLGAGTAAVGTIALGAGSAAVGTFASTRDASITAAAISATRAGLMAGVVNTTFPAASSGQALAVQLDQTGAVAVNIDGRKATYSAPFDITIGGATVQDFLQLTGAATKVVRVEHVDVAFFASVTTEYTPLQILRRSTAASGGTATQAVTVAKHETSQASNAAAILAWTNSVGQTPGTSVAPIRMAPIAPSTGSLIGNVISVDFGNHIGKSFHLANATEFLTIGLAGAASVSNLRIIGNIEWTEE